MPLAGGYDVWADSWRVDSDSGPLVVRADRGVSVATARWLAALQRRSAAAGVPCCPPLSARDGRVAFRAGDATVTVRAFAEGSGLDRDDPAQVRAAGETLALMHHTGQGTLMARPAPSPWDAALWPGDHDPPALHDPQLDAWHAALGGGEPLARGVVHGDFWAGNIIWAAGRVAAVIDFAEARADTLARELAWATWEFGHDDDHRLDIERARVFLGGYREVKGPWETRLDEVLIPLMRVELRRNARYSLADPSDAAYNTALQRDFDRLRRQPATPLLVA